MEHDEESLSTPVSLQQPETPSNIRPEEKDPIQQESPLLSVLNVVVDHIMVAPTPLEPLEFQQQCQVPLLRIFGPVLRRDSGYCIEPRQSACLYIHGAFPYLLARPKVAGPDGSLHHFSAGCNADWDSFESVKRIASDLQATLESTIQSMANADENTFHTRVIRNVTVVTGRGFYSYCPGPPAPFIRVEYYDPKVRWKVKLVLERGLDVPRSFHPDAQQYQSTSQEEDGEPLKFHCYEAHIPYTMQFFKDYNLAGMSYVHLTGGKFRESLPKSIRRRFQESSSSETPEGALFLDSNTPNEYRWKPTTTTCLSSTSMESGGDISCLQQSSAEEDTDASSQERDQSTLLVDETAVDAVWSKKETSCDVEVDITVEQILNVKSIMTDLPEDQDERQHVHWRAVPSLREIWRKERLRMSTLLKPKDDFLTPNRQEPFTLNVESKSTPGARLAVEGMKRLVGVSHGLEEQFRRAMKQIVERYASSISRVDRALCTRQPLLEGSPNIAESHQLPSSSQTPNSQVSSTDAAIEALGALASQFDEGATQDNCLSRGTPVSSQCEIASQPTETPDTVRNSNRSHQTDPFVFSQQVDRGDGVLGDSIEDLIDPSTLAPYEDDEDSEGFAEEEAMSEREFENSLSMLATQTFAREREGALVNTQEPVNDLARNSHWDTIHEGTSCDEESDTEMHDETELTAGRHFADNKTPSHSQLASASPVVLDHKDETMGDMMMQQNVNAPTRSLITEEASSETRGLYPAHRGTKAPPTWLPHCANYARSRSGNETSDHLSLLENDVEFEPIKRPPSRRKVEKWERKKRKRDASCVADPKVRKNFDNKGKEPPLANDNLQIDDNSRKLMATHQSSKNKHALGDIVHEIEDVEWPASQRNLSLSPSQSQRVNDCERPSEPEQPAGESPYEGAAENTQNPKERSSTSVMSEYAQSSSTPENMSLDPLGGIGQQGGKIYVAGAGGLKSEIRPSRFSCYETRLPNATSNLHGFDLPAPLTMMSIEIHVQCRVGRAGVNDSKEIAMRPNSEKDPVFALVYVYARDPGHGESLQVLERGCLYVPNEGEHETGETKGHDLAGRMASSIPARTMGASSRLTVETVRDEKQLLLRFASIVHWKDPDMLISWDTQGAGLGYLIERGANMNASLHEGAVASTSLPAKAEIDMIRLLGRTPRAKSADEGLQESTRGNKLGDLGLEVGKTAESKSETKVEQKWQGSGLGAEWDDRVGAGAAASSIKGRLIFAGWKIAAEEVKHPNASYLPAIVSTVLNKRIPFHDDLQLTRWYGYDAGRERWRVLHYRLTQAVACLKVFDALDVIGRASEAANLSGVEFSQSFPGIRGSQYKVEGVLLRALQSISSEERGAKRGRQKTTLPDSKAGLAIDHSSSLSNESKSQTQSPWKIRRRSGLTNDDEVTHDLCGRNYFFFSPSMEDCSRQEALECQALTLEPQSGCNDDPVVVCDFTALYPSLVIAYNLCYSTLAGKLDYHSSRPEMRQEGRTTGRLGPMVYSEARTATVLKHHLKSLAFCCDDDRKDCSQDRSQNDRVYASPTGAIYVSEAVLKGVLPQVLDELLSTRAMLKKALKHYQKLVPDLAPSIQRQMTAASLSLKYVANVTYGYTSATFSGRCASPLLADTIVECGRRTLTNAIHLANSWGMAQNGGTAPAHYSPPETIYGDTDSLFIRLPGRTVQEAFEFGEAFCKAVTASNPPPVHLKLEKVYKGSIMQTKKKYCGMKYESVDQKKPTFEAKGIETIRRDQCALTQKVLRNALITLFRSGIDAVKSYLFRQWCLILSGRVPVSDFILTGRVRSRYRGGRMGPVQAVLARRLQEADPGRVVRHKERIAYVIVATPGLTFRLKDCVLTPTELLEQWDAFTVHSAYYITKHVNAALQRCLGLAPYNIDVNSWYEACPKPRRRIHHWPVTRSGSNVMISSYFGSDMCSLCGAKCQAQGSSRAVVCDSCQKNEVQAAHTALTRLNEIQRRAQEIAGACSKCNLCFEDSSTFATLKPKPVPSNRKLSSAAKASPGIMTPLANCTCIDCPNTFERHRLREAELEAQAVCKALDL